MRPRIVPLLALISVIFSVACGSEEAPVDQGRDIAAICEERGNAVIDAIRALDRSCTTNDECQVVERAADCDCAGGVSTAQDLATFDAAISELEADMCVHPFTCAAEQCDYERGFRDSERIAICREERCEVTEVMTCAEFEENIYGDLVPPSRCETNDDCTLRTDLNPCGCSEGVGTDFPFLSAQAVYDLIAINRERCEFVCEACPAVSEAVCEQDVCVAR